MKEFFSSPFWYVLLAQIVSISVEKYVATVIHKQGYLVSFDTDTIEYSLYIVISGIISIVSLFICSILFSWWILLVFPLLTFLIIAPIVSSFLYILLVRIIGLGLDITRFLFIFITIILNIALVVLWFV